MKYQFKEGDGSHRDMSIEQCNIVLDRLRKQGYDSFSKIHCDDKQPRFIFSPHPEKGFGFIWITRCAKENKSIKNQIQFERWMEILDENEKPNVKIEMNPLEWSFVPTPINGDTMTYKWVVIEHLPKDLQQKSIIAEMKEVLTHISENQLAGYPEKLRKLAEKLTTL